MEQHDIDDAKEKQEEYWGFVLDRCTFCKTMELNKKPLAALLALPRPDNANYRKVEECLATEYEVLARYWLNALVWEHIYEMSNVMYKSLLAKHGSAVAMTMSDEYVTDRVAGLKKRFP